MHFSNPFLVDYHPENQDFSSQLSTESQIINTLNSSIEDLLSKILKVKEDYEISTHQEQLNYSQPQVMILKENTTVFNKIGHKKFLRSSPIHEDKSTLQSDDLLAKKVEQSMQKKHQMNSPSAFQHSFDTPTDDYSKPKSNRPASSNLPIQNPINQTQRKMTKIQSLFDSTFIKEVAESQVFNQGTDEGSYNTLEETTRQVQQTVVQCSIPDASPFSENITLSDFEIGASVGSGKFGEVYICRHKVTGLIFALKKIFKSTIRQYNMESQLCQELKILYMLNHPNITKLYAHFCDQYHVFLLMEYVEGGQLLSRLKSEQKYVSRVVQQLINAVDYIHNCGIVHRDIKPENIVMAFNNTVKLCDFGWAGIFDYKNMKTTFCGTLDYVSPEMKDKGIYTSKVDIWSIGVLTYEMLTGSAPFKDQINGWKKQGSKRSIPWDWHIAYPPEISGLSQSFMRNLLKQNPDERASLRFCKAHFFIRKHREQQSQINIEIYI